MAAQLGHCGRLTWARRLLYQRCYTTNVSRLSKSDNSISGLLSVLRNRGDDNGSGWPSSVETLPEVQPSIADSNERSSYRTKPDPVDGSAFEISAYPYTYEVIERVDESRIPRLKNGLDRVLFSAGTHQLRDPRSQVYNFEEHLQDLRPLERFDYESLPKFVRASEDSNLRDTAKLYGKKYAASTSSITRLLAHLYLFISQHRPPDTSIAGFSRHLDGEPDTYTTFAQSPVTALLMYRDGVYVLDTEKEGDGDNILMRMGKSMERFLTCTPEELEHFLFKETANSTGEHPPDLHHIASMGKFMLRAQIDCCDPRLPKRTFDLKTRATMAIRMDPINYQSYLGYRLKTLRGRFQSFEREFHDLMRSVLLRFCFQAKVGDMDGMFICYHNTAEVFGFQYLPTEEMEEIVFGNTAFAKEAFSMSVKVLERILDKVTEEGGEKDLRIILQTRKRPPALHIYFESLEGSIDLEKFSALEASGALGELEDDVDSGENTTENANDDTGVLSSASIPLPSTPELPMTHPVDHSLMQPTNSRNPTMDTKFSPDLDAYLTGEQQDSSKPYFAEAKKDDALLSKWHEECEGQKTAKRTAKGNSDIAAIDEWIKLLNWNSSARAEDNKPVTDTIRPKKRSRKRADKSDTPVSDLRASGSLADLEASPSILETGTVITREDGDSDSTPLESKVKFIRLPNPWQGAAIKRLTMTCTSTVNDADHPPKVPLDIQDGDDWKLNVSFVDTTEHDKIAPTYVSYSKLRRQSFRFRTNGPSVSRAYREKLRKMSDKSFGSI